MSDRPMPPTWGRGMIEGTVATGWSTMIVQGLGVLRTLLLARLLVPPLFGIVALAEVFLSIGRQLQDFNFEAGLITRGERLPSTIVAHLILRAAFALAVFGMLAVAAVGLRHWYDPRMGLVLLWFAGGSVVQALGSTPRALLERTFRLASIASVNVVSALVRLIIPVLLAWRGFGLTSLIAVSVLDMVVPALGYWWCRPSREFGRVAWGEIWEGMRWLLRFGAPLWMAGLLSNVFVLDNFLVGTFRGVEALGFYALAFTLARLPVQFIAHAVTKGTFPAFSTHQRDRARLNALFTLTYTIVVWGLVPLAALAAVAAPELVQLTIGAKWIPLIPVFRWLCVFTVLRGVQDLTVDFFVSQGKTAWFRNVLGLEAVVLVLIGPLSAWRWGPVGMAIAVDVMLGCGLPYLISHLRHVVGSGYWSAWRTPLIASLAGALAASGVVVWWPGRPLAWILGAKLLIGTGVLGTVWWLLGRDQWQALRQGLKNLWRGEEVLV